MTPAPLTPYDLFIKEKFATLKHGATIDAQMYKDIQAIYNRFMMHAYAAARPCRTIPEALDIAIGIRLQGFAWKFEVSEDFKSGCDYGISVYRESIKHIKETYMTATGNGDVGTV